METGDIYAAFLKRKPHTLHLDAIAYRESPYLAFFARYGAPQFVAEGIPEI